MKISMKEFEEAERAEAEQKRPLDQRIIYILEQNNDSPIEFIALIEMLEQKLPKGSSGLDNIWAIALAMNYSEALSKLQREGKIRKASLKNGTYYALAEARTNPVIFMDLE